MPTSTGVASGYPTNEAVVAANYNRYGIETNYVHVSGKMVFPLAEVQTGTNPPVAIVFLHQPYRIRKQQFDMVKKNTPPVIPAAADNQQDTMLSAQVSFSLPAINTGKQTLVWGAKGENVYIENSAWDLNSGYRLADFPFDTTPMDLDVSPHSPESNNGSFGIASFTNQLQSGNFRTDPDYGQELATSVLNNYTPNSIYNDHLHFPAQFLNTNIGQGN